MSCRCLMVKAFKDKQFEYVKRMNPAKRLDLFELGELSGSSTQAAVQYGVDPYIASFAWQYECRLLGKLSQEELKVVHDLCQSRPIDQVILKFPYSKAQVMRICKIWEKRILIGKEAFRAIMSALEVGAPKGSFTGNLLRMPSCTSRKL